MRCKKVEVSTWPEVGKLSTCINTNLISPNDHNVIEKIEGNQRVNKESVKGLKLEGKQMKFLPQEIRRVLPNLEALSATYSNISILTSDTLLLVGPNLKVLNMSHNLIKEIGETTSRCN